MLLPQCPPGRLDIKQELENNELISNNCFVSLVNSAIKSEATSHESEDEDQSVKVAKVLYIKGTTEEMYKMESVLMAAKADIKAQLREHRELTGMDVMNMLLDSWVSLTLLATIINNYLISKLNNQQTIFPYRMQQSGIAYMSAPNNV